YFLLMQSKATTVEQYLSGLPEERRAALAAVRKVLRANLDKDYEEGMQYGMIGYYVPHRVFPAGYHCDPRQPCRLQGWLPRRTTCRFISCAPIAPGRWRSGFARPGRRPARNSTWARPAFASKESRTWPST